MSQSNTIFDLAYKGDYEQVVKELESNPELLTRKDNNGRMLIHWAALSGNNNLVGYLIESGSPIDPPDDTDMTPLILCASAGKFDITKRLIERGAKINHRNNQGHSALQYACSKGWEEIVKYLLDKNANVNIVDIRGATPLHRCASIGHTTIVKLLLQQKSVKTNERDAYGNTPLHLACEEDRVEEAKLLVQHGAQIDMKNKDQLTPLELCSQSIASILKKLVPQRQ